MLHRSAHYLFPKIDIGRFETFKIVGATNDFWYPLDIFLIFVRFTD